MKKYLFSLLMAIGITAQAAVPTIKMTAANQFLQINQTTLVTITASEPLAGFTLSDLILSSGGSFVTDAGGATGASALTVVNPTTYTVFYKKTVDGFSTNVIVDAKSYTAVSDGSLGAYAQLGFNPQVTYYMETAEGFLNNKVRAIPQPIRLRVGEQLVNSADNSPATKAFERFYIIEKNSFRAVNDKSLFRPTAQQRVIAKLNPSPAELLNHQGAHQHGTNQPKGAYIEIRQPVGHNVPRIEPDNAECPADASGNHKCFGTTGGEGGGGDFRLTISPSHINADDPIVFPGVQGKAHTHCFFANKSVNYQTTPASLLYGSITSAAGGSINRSAYWAPCMIDTATDTVLSPKSGNFYYKSNAKIDQTEPIPQGLVGIAGNPAGTDSASRKDDTRYTCSGPGVSIGGFDGLIPECSGKIYDDLNLFVNFQSCLADDGFGKIKLDSPDHRSHWRPWGDSTPSSLPNGCTPAYPHKIATLTQNIHYAIPKNANTRTWRLSSDNYSASLPGGASLHADYWAMWSKTPIDWMARLTEQCNNTGANCGQNFLGLHAGIAIQSITTSGTTATVTTVNPHKLTVNTPLRVRISGVTGTDAAIYNFDRTKVENPNSITTPKKLLPFASQPATITGTNTLTYTLPSVPTDTSKITTEVAGALLQWGENLCSATSGCNPEYSSYYYGVK